MDTNAWFHDKVQSVLKESSTTSSGQFHQRKIPIAAIERHAIGEAECADDDVWNWREYVRVAFLARP